MASGTQLSRSLRAVVVGAVLTTALAFVAQAIAGVFEKAGSEQIDNLAARDFAWLVTGAFLLLAVSPGRAWMYSSSPRRERLMVYLRSGLAIAGVGITVDIVADFFISYFVLGAGLGGSFAWAGFLAFVLSIVFAPAALLLARPMVGDDIRP